MGLNRYRAAAEPLYDNGGEVEGAMFAAIDISDTYAGGIHAAEHGIIQLAPLELMIDNSDVGGLSTPRHPDERIPGPVWFVHDGIDGGIGFSRAIYNNFESIAERTYDHLDTCDCQRRRGCPLCIMSEHCGNQNDPLDRVVGRQILGDVIDRL